MGFDNERRVVELDEEQCWKLLERQDLGRLAVSVNDRPDIFPVNYAARDGRIYLRTSAGSKLLEMTINNHVALETDLIGADDATSVVVHGTARRLEHLDELEDAEGLSLRPRVRTDKPIFVEITPTAVDGRRFFFGGEPEGPAAEVP